MRRITTLVACLGLAIVPVALAGCGDKEPGIPRGDAAELIVLLKKAQVESDDPQRCDELLATVRDVAAKVRALPSSTDPDVRASLANGVRNLAASARSECENTQTTTTTTPTVPTTETVPPPTTETVPPPTTETVPPPPTTETTPPATTPPVPTTPGTGGAGPGNGNGNGINGQKRGGGHGRFGGGDNGNGSAGGDG
jgi:hypothetical protein